MTALAYIVAALSLLVAGVMAALYASAMSRRRRALGPVLAQLEELSRGNLTHRAVADGPADIAELVSATNRLAESMQVARSDALRREEAHRQLISNLSHDLRTPITSIAGYVDALQRGIGEDPERHLGVIASKTAELTRLADDLFYLTRLDAGDLSLTLVPVDVNEVARQALLGFEHELSTRGIEVVAEIPEARCAVLADEAALGRVIGNFIANSLKHARSMTHLGVGVETGDEGCSVVVWDDGEGFSKGVAELLERGSSVGPGGGAGLGLSIAHDLASRMGATLQVHSERGIRTSVRLSFPPTSRVANRPETV